MTHKESGIQKTNKQNHLRPNPKKEPGFEINRKDFKIAVTIILNKNMIPMNKKANLWDEIKSYERELNGTGFWEDH